MTGARKKKIAKATASVKAYAVFFLCMQYTNSEIGYMDFLLASTHQHSSKPLTQLTILMRKGLLLWSSYSRVFEILFEKIPFLRRHWNAGHRHSRVHSFEAGLCGMQFQFAEQCDNRALLNRLDPLWRISCRFFGTASGFCRSISGPHWDTRCVRKKTNTSSFSNLGIIKYEATRL